MSRVDSFLTLTAGLVVLTLGLKMTHGSSQLGWLWTLPISISLFALALAPDFKARGDWRKPLRVACYGLPALLFIAGGFFFKPNTISPPSVVYSEPLSESLITLGQNAQYIAALLAAACLLTAACGRLKTAEFLFQATLVVAGGISLFVLSASPRPWIDVWSVQEGAANALLRLKNPYGVEHYNMYPKYLRELFNPFGVIFVYMPGIIYLMAPFKALGLDTRVALVIAHIASALSLSWLARGAGWTGARRYFSALLFVSVPFVPFMMSMAWNDVFTVLFIPLVALALQRKNDRLFIASMVGLLLIKQHIAVCFPLLFWVGYREIGFKFWRSLVAIGAATLLACTPFLIWGWRDFLGSLYGLHFLKFTVPENIPERKDSFSLFYWLRDELIYLPPGLLAITAGATVLFAFWFWQRRSTTAVAMTLCGLILMNTFAFAGSAFLNYYWVPMAFIFVALATLDSPRALITK